MAFAATALIAISLTLIVLLTQSLRYLEIVISTDASMVYFLIMTGLAVPKFLELILPLAFVIACAYRCQKLVHDREIMVMRASGVSVLRYSRGLIYFTGFMMILQFILSGWVAPMSVAQLQQTRDDVKSHYATLVFREGVFNELGNGMTVFIEERVGMNEMRHLVIHDKKGFIEKGRETTIIANRGIVNFTDNLRQILIYDGTRYQKKTGDNADISRLDFGQYILDIPTTDKPISTRWREPDERTFDRLFLSRDHSPQRDLQKSSEFTAEIHNRITKVLVYPVFAGFVLIFIFMGQWNRAESSMAVFKLAGIVIIVQTLHILFADMAQKNVWMVLCLYAVIFVPIVWVALRFLRHYRIKSE